MLRSAVILICLAATLFASGEDRPNILFLFADDWGRYAGCYAEPGKPSLNDVVRTPNIDRLAREGVRFRNAFVPAPSCTPCRSSLLSGRWFWRTGRGAILQGAKWDAAIPSWPLLLRDSGYHIGKSGKVWSPGTPADAPFGGQSYAHEKAGRQFNNFSESAARMMAAGKSLDESKAAIMAEVRGNFDAFLRGRAPGKPWCYWLGSTTVHRTWEKGSGPKQWGIDPGSLKGKLPAHLPDVPEVRADMADAIGEIQAWDAEVGAVLQRLEESGELERTIIIVSGDHGMPGMPGGKCNLYDYGTGVALVARIPGGKAGRVVEDFVNLMDLAPTFLEAAGVKVPDGMNGRSILPQLNSDKAGWIDSTRDWVITGRERHVENAREGGLPYPMRALRTKELLYIRNFTPDRWPMGEPLAANGEETLPLHQLENNTRLTFPDMDASPTKAWLIQHRKDKQWQWHFDFAFAKRPAEELFDLASDPGQIKNVAAEPAYAERKGKLAERLLAVLRDSEDPRVTGDGGTYDQPPFAGVEHAAGGR